MLRPAPRRARARRALFFCALSALPFSGCDAFMGEGSNTSGNGGGGGGGGGGGTTVQPSRLTVGEQYYETREPFRIVVDEAYIDDAPGWVVVRADDNGQPGEILGHKRVPERMRDAEWLVIEPETALSPYQTLHVELLRDEPRNSQFDGDEPPAIGADGEPLTETYELHFVSTTTDEDSPYYANPCPFDQWYEDPTDLPVDCRCSPNVVTLDPCHGDRANGRSDLYGTGPRMDSMPFDAQVYGGFAVGTEVFVSIRWQDENHVDPGLIMAIDYETGDRRLVSGRYPDPNAGYEVIGDGPELHEPQQFLLGEDGHGYAFTWRDQTTYEGGVSITRVDLDTGDRETVWASLSDDFGQCDNGADPPGTQDVQFVRDGMAMDPDGNFYIATISNGRPASGRGIVRISADGQACEYVTMDGVAEGNAYYPSVGEGYPVGQFNYAGMLWHEGYIYAVNNGDLIRIDPDTGDRRRIAGDGASDVSGSLDGHFIDYDPTMDLLIVSGMTEQAQAVLGVRIDDGYVHQFARCLNVSGDLSYATDCFEGPASTLGRSERMTIVLPNGNWFSALGRSFVVIEPRTGNSMVMSY